MGKIPGWLVMNIVVVGGGTAGWLTALFAQKKYPNDNILLIESEKIGILGAGEAGTVQLVMAFDFLGIPTSDILSKTNATIKNAARFSGWSKKTKRFYHPFLINSDLSEQNFSQYFYPFFESSFPVSHMYAKINNKKMEDYCLIDKLCEKNLTPFIKTKDGPISFFDMDQIAFWSLSFDANLMAKFLSSIAIDRGVKRIVGEVESFEKKESGDISKIIYSNGEVSSDFIFDCTGFQRLIIGKLYNSKWKSYKENIPVNRALPFFLPSDEEIPPFIEANAMEYGWMWKTPLQNRYGCGYVFDSNFISDDKAKTEIEKVVGKEVSIPKIFSFEPGSYEEIWINNVLAVGLSAGFIEPLEATSLWSTINYLALFFSSEHNIKNKNKKHKDKFNKIFQEKTQEIVDFIYLHYVTNKDDTEFWKNFTKNNRMPEFTEYVLETIKERPLSQDFDFRGRDMFSVNSYFYLLIGHDFIDKDVMQKYKEMTRSNKDSMFFDISSSQDYLISNCINHTEFLQNFKK